ncbi:MAG: BrnT family toxin [bacterium]
MSFEETKTVFYDQNALLINDPDHSDYEERFIILGLSYVLRILVVCHCYRKSDKNIRLIAARKAEKKKKINIRGICGIWDLGRC